MLFINFQTLSVQVQNLNDIGKVTINMGDNPASWQASFISPTYYPPGTEINILGFPFIVTTVSKQTANIYQYSAYLKASIVDMSAMGKIDNTGAYERIPNTNPYSWRRLGDLTAAIQSVVRNRSQNTLTTPFERSFDRFESTINWTSDSIRDALSLLYISSQTLVIPWYNTSTQQIDWITVDDWVSRMPISADNITITHVNTIGRPKGVKIFTRNRYKRAVTMYECPVAINPGNELLDVGFYVMACDGNERPTVRFTYNYNVGFNFITRVDTTDEHKDDSGMVTVTKETADDGSTILKPTYWYENIKFDIGDPDSNKNITNLVQLYLKALVFVANPIITFDSENDYLDSYFPYPISPWNFQVYLKPTNTGKWIPTGNPYPIYDRNLIANLPGWVWTGAYCSVARLPTLPQADTSMQKEIVHQGFYVNGFNVGNMLTPFSLLTVENQTQMPIIADGVVSEYLNDLSKMPNIPYNVYMVSNLQKRLYQYGLTINQVTDDTDAYPSKTLTLDLSTNTLSIDGKTISSAKQSYGPADVYICYELQRSSDTKQSARLRDEFDIGLLKILPPKSSQRMEKYIIIVFSTAVYFITYRVFASPAFLCAPYVYKFGEDYAQTLTSDYDIIITSNYSSLISRISHYVDKAIVFEWEGHVDEYPGFIPYRFFNGYAISHVSIVIDGDYVKATCVADNRLRLYRKWSKVLTDITPQKCDIELYPRIPNRHYPTSKIYAFSDRTQKVQEYLNKVLKYVYLDSGNTFNITTI